MLFKKNCMKTIIRKTYTWMVVVLVSMVFTACDLTEEPKSTASKDVVFGSESGLELYSYSFYDILPTGTNIVESDAMTDYLCRSSVPDFLLENGYSANDESEDDGEWNWEDLRNVNYFIQNCTDESVDEDVRRNYIGLARFFRAWFYFDKVVRYGDVPWVNEALDVDDDELYGERDSRELVIDSVLADLDYACENMTTTSDDTRSLITTYVAYAFKSRVALFEGTYRKYHTDLGLSGTVDNLLQQARDAAKVVMDESGFSVYTGDGTDLSYRDLFISTDPVSEEIMLAYICSESAGVYNDANWWWTSSTYGDRCSFIRTFVNTYLNLDGTTFTSTTDYSTMTFMDEVKNRDMRLQQTIRLGDYERISSGEYVAAPPVFSYTYTGYQPIKWVLDDDSYDGGADNINSISLIRYAEVLLNYAEAQAELGELTDAEWSATIGTLRGRAGITDGLSSKPTAVDTYLQQNYYPSVTDATILEVRRERGIELALEGFRYRDILRWKVGDLMTMEWNGFYVPSLDVAMDLNEDGEDDVAFYQTAPTDEEDGVTYVNVAATLSTGSVNPQLLRSGTYGEITWRNDVDRVWDDKMYLYPIPSTAITVNPNLTQNEGW